MEPSVWAITAICRGRHIPTMTAEASAEAPNLIKTHITCRNVYSSDAKFNACFSINIVQKKTRKLSKRPSRPGTLLLNQLSIWQRRRFPSDSTTVDMIFAALCTAANIKQRHLIRGSGQATTANGRERERETERDQAAKTHQQLALISNADIECGTAHFPTGEEEKTKKQIWRRTLLSGADKVLRLYFNVQDSVSLHTLYEN